MVRFLSSPQRHSLPRLRRRQHAFHPTSYWLIVSNVDILDPSYSRGNSSRDEELGSIRVLAGVGHTEHASLAVLQLEVLIRKFLAVDGLSTSA